MQQRGAVLYDGLYVAGGAEQVSLDLAHDLQADLICAARDESLFPTAALHVPCRILSSVLLANPALRLLHATHAFRRHAALLQDYDWVLFSGTSAPFAALESISARRYYYCHTPPRFVYDLREYYLAQIPAWQRPAFNALRAWIKPRYEAAVGNMETLIANSENVRQRIRHYLGRDAMVVHPPCDIDGFRWIDAGDYYLSTARLEPYKRVDVIVRAFLAMPDRKLIVASGGTDEARLRRIAGAAPNIRFVGWQSPAALRELVGRALATIYIPRDEDFGISPVESMAAGKPVIGVAEGGVLETVLPEQTGVLLPANPQSEDLISTVLQLDGGRAVSMRSACERQAQVFSRARFRQRIRGLILGDGVANSSRVPCDPISTS